MTTNHTYDEACQGRTKPEADRHRDDWTNEDLELVAAFRGESTVEDLALATGRTYYAIHAILQVLDERLARAEARRRTNARPSQRAYTFIGDDVPEGW